MNPAAKRPKNREFEKSLSRRNRKKMVGNWDDFSCLQITKTFLRTLHQGIRGIPLKKAPLDKKAPPIE